MANVFGPKPHRHKKLPGISPGPTYAKVGPPQEERPEQAPVRSQPARRSLHRNAEYRLSRPQLERLISSATNDRDRALVTLFVDTGIRRFEAAGLRCADLDLSTGLLTVRHGKGDKLRMLPLSPRLCLALGGLTRSDPDEPLFRRADHQSLSNRQVNRIVARTGDRAGLRNPNPRQRNITCHLLRHSFARHWKEAGGDIETLARILGHESVKTTWDLYGSLSLDDIKRHYRTLFESFGCGEDT